MMEDSSRDRARPSSHPAIQLLADRLNSGWIVNVTRFFKYPDPKLTRLFRCCCFCTAPLKVLTTCLSILVQRMRKRELPSSLPTLADKPGMRLPTVLGLMWYS